MTRQSIRPPVPVPARTIAVVVLLAGGAASLPAQTTFRVAQAENFRRDPSTSAAVLARVSSGTQMAGGRTQDGWTEITLEGWIWSQSVEPTTGEFDLRVTARGGENLRSAPNRSVVARVEFGTLLDRIEREGRWIRVRRRGWMWNQSLTRVGAASPAAPSPAVPPPRPAVVVPDSAVRLDRAVLERDAPLRTLPEGDSIGSLAGDAPVKILARSGDWVRVQVQAWIREADLRPATPGVLVGVSGAEVRAQPEEYLGKVLQWTVQYIAIQEADELRSDIPLGQSYLLARGPLPETGFVYVVLSEEQRDQIERLPRLANLVIVGRVRTPRSRYLGNTILDLVDFAERQQ